MTIPADDAFGTTPVVIQTKLKATPNGTSYADPVTRGYFVEDGRKLVRGTDGEQVISESTIFTPPADFALFTTGTKVTVNGRDSTVIIAKLRVIGDTDVDHVEVNLT